MDKNKNKSFVKWLEWLQQESWELELLISGFSIFLLASAYDYFDLLEYRINILDTGKLYVIVLRLLFHVLVGAWYVLMVNLMVHVLLRGLWISTIGLRSVSGDIDFDRLRLSPKFDRFLRKRIVSFDHYIQRLEELCSIVFGFTFLIIFLLISMGLFVIGIVLLGYTIKVFNENYGKGWLSLLVPLLIFYLLGGLLFFVDFITLGWFKRRKRIAKFYYPIYRFFSLITFSSVYRPMYYNLIDNSFGRKVVLLLIPYLMVFMLVSTMQVENFGYLPGNREEQTLNNELYDDSWDSSQLSYQASINSKYISNGYVELYLPYFSENDDKAIQKLCPDIVPAKKGIFVFGRRDFARDSMDAKAVLECHSQRFRIYVNDSLLPDVKYRFLDHLTRKTQGLLTIIDVSYLDRGEHGLRIEALVPDTIDAKDTLLFRPAGMIPFWTN